MKVIKLVKRLTILASLISCLILTIIQIFGFIKTHSFFYLSTSYFFGVSFIMRLVTFCMFLLEYPDKTIGLVFFVLALLCNLSIPAIMIDMIYSNQYSGFIISWFIYFYALFGFVNMVFTSIELWKDIHNMPGIYKYDCDLNNLTTASFTIFKMCHSLFCQFGQSETRIAKVSLFSINIVVYTISIVSLALMFRAWKKAADDAVL